MPSHPKARSATRPAARVAAAAGVGSRQPDGLDVQDDAHTQEHLYPQDGLQSRDALDGMIEMNCTPAADSLPGVRRLSEALPSESEDTAAMEIRTLCMKYRSDSSFLDEVIMSAGQKSSAICRRENNSFSRPSSPNTAQPRAQALHHDDVVPWRKIVLCARHRAASMALLKEFVITLAFTCVYLTTLNAQLDASGSFQVSGAMRGAVADARAMNPRGDMKGFFDIKSHDDWYDWLGSVLVAQYYGSTEQDHMGRPYAAALRHMLNWQNRICGGVTVVQQRSSAAPCFTSAAGIALSEACTSDGDWDNTRPYGRCHPGFFRTCTRDNKFGTGSNISNGIERISMLDSSFFVQLGPDESSAKAQVRALQEGAWVDSLTRRLQVFVHVWNLNTDMLQSHEMAVVFYAGGITRVFFTERHTKSELYNLRKPEQLSRAVSELLVLAFLVYFWFVELRDIYFSWHGKFFRVHFKCAWNIVDLIHCGIMSAAAIVWVLCIVYLPRDHFLPMFDADDAVASSHALALLDFFPLYDLYVHLSAVTVFFNLLKMLKTFRFHLKTSVVVNTLSNMASPLFGFLAGFSVIFFGFVYVAHIDFGLFLMDWHSMVFAAGSAVNAIFQVLPLSDIDRLPLFANYYFAWQFVFIIVINFVSMNLIVAIIIEGYLTNVERMKIRRYSSQSIVDQIVVAVIAVFCSPFPTMLFTLHPRSNQICQRIHALHEQISGIFGRRFQLQYCAPYFVLSLCDLIAVPNHNAVSFGFILSEIQRKFALHGDTDSCREAVSEILLHFMNSIQKHSRTPISAEHVLKPRQHVQRTAEVCSSDARSITVQLRDEAVLMLRSHARTLQRHSDALHSVSVSFLHVKATSNKCQILVELNESDSPSAKIGPVSIYEVCSLR
jgi:hypothetical protein